MKFFYMVISHYNNHTTNNTSNEILPDIDKYGNSYAKPIYTPRFPDSLSPCDTGQGAACSLYDLDNNGFLDAIFVAIENIKGKSNSWKYVTGHNLNKQGVPMCWR